VEELKGGKIEYRADKAGIVHVSFGKTSFKEKDLIRNLKAVQVRAASAIPPNPTQQGSRLELLAWTTPCHDQCYTLPRRKTELME